MKKIVVTIEVEDDVNISDTSIVTRLFSINEIVKLNILRIG
jgi:hypothetical protein